MDTTIRTAAMAGRAAVESLVGTAPDARPMGSARAGRPRTAWQAVAPHPFPGAPVAEAPLSA